MMTSIPPMFAFHNDPGLKDLYIARVRAHRVADELVHGQYWQEGRGCGVGCTIHSGQHAEYESLLGIPEALAYLEDSIFEKLSPPWDQDWPEAFLAAIPVGADLTDVPRQFLLRLLTDPTHGVLQYVAAPQWTAQREAIERVATLLQHPPWTAAEAAWDAAEAADAAAWAARTAADAAADAAAEAAAETAGAAAWAARVAAEAAGAAAEAAGAGWAAAEAAADAAAWGWQRATLLDLLRAAPIPVPTEKEATP